MLDNVHQLNNFDSFWFWLSIVFILLGVYFQVRKLYIDKKRKEIRKPFIRSFTWPIFIIIIGVLIQIVDYNIDKKIKWLENPYNQTIQTGKAEVKVNILGADNIIADGLPFCKYHDVGGNIEFIKKDEIIIRFSSIECMASRGNNGEIIFQGEFNLDSAHPDSCKKLPFLKEAEYIQVEFEPLEKNHEVSGGNIVCTFNDDAILEFSIPKQKISNRKIFVRDITTYLEEIFQ